MRTWRTRVLHWAFRRMTDTRKFPRGDLRSFLFRVAKRGFDPAHIVDVGARRGKWSRTARRVFPDCRFTLVEPQMEMKPYLDKFCRDSKGSRWINAGVGAALGQLPLTIVPHALSATFAMSKTEAQKSRLQQRIVPIVTLDQLASVFGAIPDIVKIDAQGFQCEIMKGARTLVGQTELFLFNAPLDDPPPLGCGLLDIASMMADLGYAPYDFTTFHRRPWDGAVGGCEIVFVRNKGRLRSRSAPRLASPAA